MKITQTALVTAPMPQHRSRRLATRRVFRPLLRTPWWAKAQQLFTYLLPKRRHEGFERGLCSLGFLLRGESTADVMRL